MADLKVTDLSSSGGIVWNPVSENGDSFVNSGSETIFIKTAKLSNQQLPPIRNIVAVKTPDDLTVVVGTSFNNLGLPNTVACTLDDATSINLAVVWESAGYNSNATGENVLEGVVTLSEYITNTSSIEAAIAVHVIKKQIDSVFNFPDMIVEKDTSASAFTALLPLEGYVTLNDETCRKLPISWSGVDAVDLAVPGSYYLAGTPSLGVAITNPANHTAELEVIVKESVVAKNIKSASTPADISVAIGTLFANLTLPPTIQVTLDDNSTKMLPCIWTENSSYTPDTAGTYVFTGAFTLDASVTNTLNIKPTISVVVDTTVIAAALSEDENIPVAAFALTATPVVEGVVNVTIKGQIQCNQGHLHDLSVIVPRGVEYAIGKINMNQFNGPGNIVTIYCDTTEDVSLAVIRR